MPARAAAPAGNLYVSISVKKHDYFTREGDDILYELPSTSPRPPSAPRPRSPPSIGPTKVKVPAGSQTGRVFRLRDKGIPHLHGLGRGDQIVVLRVVTPESLSKEQKKLFEELAKSLGGK